MDNRTKAFIVFSNDGECVTDIVSRKKNDYTTKQKVLIHKKDICKSEYTCPICSHKKVYTIDVNCDVTPEFNHWCSNCNALFSINMENADDILQNATNTT